MYEHRPCEEECTEADKHTNNNDRSQSGGDLCIMNHPADTMRLTFRSLQVVMLYSIITTA